MVPRVDSHLALSLALSALGPIEVPICWSLYSMHTSSQDMTTPSYRQMWTPMAASEWCDFHGKWWGGRALLQGILDKPPDERFLDGLGAVLRRLGIDIRSDIDSLFVRRECMLFAERLRNGRKHPLSGVLLLGQPGIGKSVFLLYLLVECLSREELVIFTSSSERTFLFDKYGVARMDTSNFDHYDHLPDVAGNTPGMWSLIDCPMNKDPLRNRLTDIGLFFVAALSSDESRYHSRVKDLFVRRWYISPWNNDELLPLLRVTPPDRFAQAARERFPVPDAAAVESLVSWVGPCPRDILRFLHDPDGYDASVRSAIESYRGEATAVAHLLNLAHTSSDEHAHTVALVAPLDPPSTTVFTDDGCTASFKSRAIYERMLDSLLARSDPLSAVAGMRQLCGLIDHSRWSAGAVPFVFDHYAVCCALALGLYPVDEAVAPQHHFAPMLAPAPLAVGSTMSYMRFVYGQPEQPGHTRRPLTLVVDASGAQPVSYSWQTSHPSQAAASHHPPASEAAAPWAARRRVLYENIDELGGMLSGKSYYAPAAAVRARADPPLQAFFFEVVPPGSGPARLRLGQRGGAKFTVTVPPRASGSSDSQSDPRETLNFETVREMRERARRVWTAAYPAPAEVEVEVKYVLVVPHDPQREGSEDACRFDVEWRFPASEVELDSEAQRPGPGLGGRIDWARSKFTTSRRDNWEPTPNPAWRDFRNTYWDGARGRAALKTVLEKPPLERFLHVEQACVRDLMPDFLPDGLFFVREEYSLFGDRFRKARETTQASDMRGCLLLGQRGIGKSYFLLFSPHAVLVSLRRFAFKEPQRYATFGDANVPVRSLVRDVGPCLGDVLLFLTDPGFHKQLVDAAVRRYTADLRAIHLLLSGPEAHPSEDPWHKLVLISWAQPVDPDAIDNLSDRVVVRFKTRAIYDRMLANVLSFSTEQTRRARLYDDCSLASMGWWDAPPADFADFLFESVALRYVLADLKFASSDPTFRRFAPMTRIGPLRGTGRTTRASLASAPVRFGYRPNGADARRSTVVVDVDGVAPSELSPPPCRYDGRKWDPLAGTARRRVVFDRVEDLRAIDDYAACYSYCPASGADSPFDAIQIVTKPWDDCSTVDAGGGFRHARGAAEASRCADGVSRSWSLIAVEYVSVVPYEEPGFGVEWRLPATGFEEHPGEVFVQFLDVDMFGGRVADVLGVPRPANACG
ncbi:hypothetical protein LXA43DRAFT_1113630 [Ganoderma leucocontextum]|nr:hypothetical protein LXA43DRAFT_1113630 [Ganoderma leucocontextum]